jgi:starvation-inducible DNA-binding protein
LAGRVTPLPANPPINHRSELVSTQPDGPNPPLAEELSEEIGRHLQLTLVELIALSLTGKQLQWNTYGREFLALHRHLDDLVDEWQELEDAVAERAVALGIPADGSAAAVLELGNLRPLEPGFTETGCAVQWLCAQLWEVALRVRQRSEVLADMDSVSQDVVVDVCRKLEEQLWMMRAQLTD